MPRFAAPTRLAMLLLPVSLALLGAPSAHAGELGVVSTVPAARGVAPVSTTISITFDRPVDRASVPGAFRAFGRWSGRVAGSFQYADADATVTLVPDRALSAGETVMVYVAETLQGTDGVPLRAGGHSFQFWTRALPGSGAFKELETLLVHQPGEQSRAYGGFASDLDGDGWLDITIVNEDTADLRVFLNAADGTGAFHDYTQPTFPVGNRASPSEPGDFNDDGVVDVAVCDINDGTVSILLGDGAGGFLPRQVVPVGGDPRGVAVLDADGDGDIDVVNTNFSSDNLSYLENDGTGTFAAPVFFDSGLAGEWALAAADMNEDGLLDLVVGARSSQRVVVMTADGDGTFTAGISAACGGSVWMLVCGDVNGDGHEDVACANSSQGNGAILAGDGQGGVALLATHPVDPFPLATDLGDLDGDGDLDWTVSSFSGDWSRFENDGTGTFAFVEEYPAPEAASCSLLLDFDNDRDLDIALIDELADVVILMEQVGTPIACAGDLDGDGTVGVTDLLAVLGDWGCTSGCAGDADGDGAVDVADLLLVLGAWGDCG